jgi:hypothetical protein
MTLSRILYSIRASFLLNHAFSLPRHAERTVASEVSVSIILPRFNDVNSLADRSLRLGSVTPVDLFQNIVDLANCVRDQGIWWSQAETMLLETNIQAPNLTLVDTTQRRWEVVRKAYMDYKTSVSSQHSPQ